MEILSAYQHYGSKPISNLMVRIRSGRQLGRRYNAQTYPEVAALVNEISTDGTFSEHDIIIHERSSGLRRINSLHSSYMALHYTLMFSFSKDGWSPKMQSIGSTNEISIRGYCAYMLMIRDDYYIHHYDRLFQQYVVENYVRIEAHRLNYFALNRKQFRSELYSGFGDDANPRQIGRSIILPASFHDGPRFMPEKLQYCLAIIRQKGRPSLFITVTCNPKCVRPP